MSTKSKILVCLQILLMLFLIIRNNIITSGYLLVIQVFGVFLGVWAILTIKIGNFNIQPEVKSEILIIKGPYKLIRNPMYTGLIMVFIPVITGNFNYLNLFVFICLMMVLLLKIFSEEQFLEHTFKEGYLKYKKESFRLIPYIF